MSEYYGSEGFDRPPLDVYSYGGGQLATTGGAALGRERLGPGREPLGFRPWGLLQACLCLSVFVCVHLRKYLVGRQWAGRPICVCAALAPLPAPPLVRT